MGEVDAPSLHLLADGGLPVVAGNVVPPESKLKKHNYFKEHCRPFGTGIIYIFLVLFSPDSVVVDVVEDGEALSSGLWLRASGEGAGGVGPVAGAGHDALRAAVLPAKGAGVTARGNESEM